MTTRVKMKCCILGDSGVGKSSLIRAFASPNSKTVTEYGDTTNSSESSTIPTTKKSSLVVDRFLVKVMQRGTEVSIEFWVVGGDVGPQRETIYSETDCFLLCFSVNSKTSFDNIEEKWLNDITKCAPSAAIFVVGCKTDKRTPSGISFRDGQELSSRINAIGYVECSSVTQLGIKEVFDETITTILLRNRHIIDNEENDDFDFLEGEDRVIEDVEPQKKTSNQGNNTYQIKKERSTTGYTPAPINSNSASVSHGNAGNYGNNSGVQGNHALNGEMEDFSVVLLEQHFDVPVSSNTIGDAPSLNGSSSPVLPTVSETVLSLIKKQAPLEHFFVDHLRAELLKEFRIRNKSVINFLAQSENLSYLVSVIAKADKSIQEQFSAVELLTADVSAILDCFGIEEYKLWDKLFQFFDYHRPPLKNKLQSANNFVRVVSFLVSNRNIEFSLFMKERKDTLERIIDHIGLEPFVSLIMVMLDCESSLETLNVDLIWSNELVPLLGRKLERSKEILMATDKTDLPAMSIADVEQDLTGIADLVENIIMRYPKSRLINSLQQSAFIKPLLSNTFDENLPTALQHMIILLKLLSTCKNTSEYETHQLPPVIAGILQLIDNEEDEGIMHKSESFSDGMSLKSSNASIKFHPKDKPLQRLYKLLYKPPSNLPTSITTTCGVIAPLGPFRLKCVQLILVLLKANYHLVDTALIEHRVISRAVDLFFQYKWNNILHCLVETICMIILESKQSYLCLYLLRDCSLLDRILQAQQNEEQEKKMKNKRDQGIPHQGYMGHLINIANAISKTSKMHSAIFYLLEDVPSRGWKRFEEKLKQEVQRQETSIGGMAPERRQPLFRKPTFKSEMID